MSVSFKKETITALIFRKRKKNAKCCRIYINKI